MPHWVDFVVPCSVYDEFSSLKFGKIIKDALITTIHQLHAMWKLKCNSYNWICWQCTTSHSIMLNKEKVLLSSKTMNPGITHNKTLVFLQPVHIWGHPPKKLRQENETPDYQSINFQLIERTKQNKANPFKKKRSHTKRSFDSGSWLKEVAISFLCFFFFFFSIAVNDYSLETQKPNLCVNECGKS